MQTDNTNCVSRDVFSEQYVSPYVIDISYFSTSLPKPTSYCKVVKSEAMRKKWLHWLGSRIVMFTLVNTMYHIAN